MVVIFRWGVLVGRVMLVTFRSEVQAGRVMMMLWIQVEGTPCRFAIIAWGSSSRMYVGQSTTWDWRQLGSTNWGRLQAGCVTWSWTVTKRQHIDYAVVVAIPFRNTLAPMKRSTQWIGRILILLSFGVYSLARMKLLTGISKQITAKSSCGALCQTSWDLLGNRLFKIILISVLIIIMQS